ncbi:MAG TPA: GNAT family N-acetyltransferase [Caulobacteraceae bacterium]|nr:GNAT family N-acetyltransferase [Caulobacteraceae bacterium]
MVDVRLFQPVDLDGVIALCANEGWPSFPEDPARALRALTAPGVTTVVAADGGHIAGFAQLLSDGEIQAHLSLIAVDPAYRRRNLAREMLRLALADAGGSRIDLITETAAEFYAALPHRRLDGFRIWPQIDKLPQ